MQNKDVYSSLRSTGQNNKGPDHVLKGTFVIWNGKLWGNPVPATLHLLGIAFFFKNPP